jgi:hypothetical protein
MYVLQLDGDERDFLLSLLKSRSGVIGRKLSTKLRTTEDVFGVVMWTDDDIKSLLEQKNLPSTRENIARVRASYFGRHIDDQMVEHGWEVLEQGVLELM